jgi:N-hydroxyarylamine O-acetyltransferase
MSLDLDGYFARIGWSGAAAPDLATLTALLSAHMRAIPFENFDALLGRRVHLDLDRLQAKLVRGRRGGYCFEHATLFAEVLSALGFRVTSHLARVVLFTPKAESSRTHMVNLVELPEGRFVVDPGFGGPAALVPIPLIDAGRAQPGSGVSHWFAHDGEDWILRGPGKDGPADLWVSLFSTDYPVDFELSNHYVATHPDSVFTHNIMLNLFTADGRVSLMNRDVSERQGVETRGWRVADRQALAALLVERFGIALPEALEVRVPAVPDWT